MEDRTLTVHVVPVVISPLMFFTLHMIRLGLSIIVVVHPIMRCSTEGIRYSGNIGLFGALFGLLDTWFLLIQFPPGMRCVIVYFPRAKAI